MWRSQPANERPDGIVLVSLLPELRSNLLFLPETLTNLNLEKKSESLEVNSSGIE